MIGTIIDLSRDADVAVAARDHGTRVMVTLHAIGGLRLTLVLSHDQAHELQLALTAWRARETTREE